MYRQTEELYLPHRKAEQMNGTISRQALRRLPFYLDYLKKKQADGYAIFPLPPLQTSLS